MPRRVRPFTRSATLMVVDVKITVAVKVPPETVIPAYSLLSMSETIISTATRRRHPSAVEVR